MDPKVQFYYNYFKNRQVGGELHVFRGAPQYGNCIGDFLRGIFGRVFPVILRGATGFVNAASKASDEGASPLEAAKAGLRPGAAGLVSGAVNALQKYQSGSGRKRKHRRVYKEVKRAKLSHSNLPQIKYNF